MNNMAKLHIEWNEFESIIRESFKELREEEDFFDVTLACDDGQQIRAHKLVLTAGSKFFREIFKKNKHANLVIYLKGIKRADLEHIIEFLYNGEAFVAQEELNIFLETAKELQVKGLQSNTLDDLKQTENNEISSESHYEAMEGNCPSPKDEVNDVSGDALALKTEQENVDHFEVDLEMVTSDPDDSFVDQQEEGSIEVITNAELDLQIESVIVKNEGMWQCKVCGKTTKIKQHMKYHAEKHIPGQSHTCPVCNKVFATRNSMKSHLYKLCNKNRS